jgi:hypothetical protein
LVPTLKAFLRRQKFKKQLPSLIKQRMVEREEMTKIKNENIRNKLQSIFADDDEPNTDAPVNVDDATS